MAERKVISKVLNHTEPGKHSMAQKVAELAEKGKKPQEIKEPVYLYSTLDYPEKLTYTNGEELIISPKSKQLVDKSLIDQSALRKGFKLHHA